MITTQSKRDQLMMPPYSIERGFELHCHWDNFSKIKPVLVSYANSRATQLKRTYCNTYINVYISARLIGLRRRITRHENKHHINSKTQHAPSCESAEWLKNEQLSRFVLSLCGEQGLIRHPIFGCYDISLFHDITSDVTSITYDGFEKKAHAAKPQPLGRV